MAKAKLSKAKKDHIEDLIIQGDLTFTEIAKKYKVSVKTISLLGNDLKDMKKARDIGAKKAIAEVKQKLEKEGKKEVLTFISKLQTMDNNILSALNKILNENIKNGKMQKMDISNTSQLKTLIESMKMTGEMAHQHGLADLRPLKAADTEVNVQNNIQVNITEAEIKAQDDEIDGILKDLGAY